MARILLVDDSQSVLAQITQWLVSAGHDVAPMISGKAAIERARVGGFDLVITDLYMPDLDGIELIQKLRAHQARTPFIMISSNGEEFGLFALARKFGALATLAKPFTAERLQAEVTRALAPSPSARDEESDVRTL